MGIGGVMECASGVGIISGLESLFHGLEGIAPMVKDCHDEKNKILDLLHTFEDFRNPHALAQTFAHHILVNRVDLTVELAQAILDSVGRDYLRVGEDVGHILSKIVISNASVVTKAVVVV